MIKKNIIFFLLIFFVSLFSNLYPRHAETRYPKRRYTEEENYFSTKPSFNGYDLMLSLLTKYKDNNEQGFFKTGITKSSILKFVTVATISSLLGALWYYPTTRRSDFSLEDLKFPNLVPYFIAPSTLFFLLIWFGHKYYQNSKTNSSKLKYVLEHFDIIKQTIPSLVPVLENIYFDNNKNKIYINEDQQDRIVSEDEAEKIIFSILNICWSNASKDSKDAIKNIMLSVASDPKLKLLVCNL